MPIRFSPGGESLTRKLFRVQPLGLVVVAVDAEALVTGVEALGSVGTLTATGGGVASLTGVEAIAAAGTVVATGAASATAVGVEAVSAAGTVVGSGAANTNVTGVEAIGAAGTVVAGVAASAPVIGVEAVSAAGTMAGTGTAVTAISGVEATGAVGTVVASGDLVAARGGSSAYRVLALKPILPMALPIAKPGTAVMHGVAAVGAVGQVIAFGMARTRVQGVTTRTRTGTICATGIQNPSDEMLAWLADVA